MSEDSKTKIKVSKNTKIKNNIDSELNKNIQKIDLFFSNIYYHVIFNDNDFIRIAINDVGANYILTEINKLQFSIDIELSKEKNPIINLLNSEKYKISLNQLKKIYIDFIEKKQYIESEIRLFNSKLKNIKNAEEVNNYYKENIKKNIHQKYNISIVDL